MSNYSTQTALSDVPPALAKRGWHNARLVRIIELGYQPTFFSDPKTGQTKQSTQLQGMFTWELYGRDNLRQFKAGAPYAPMVISKTMALSLYGKSRLAQFLSNWFGDTITDMIHDETLRPHALVGNACKLQIDVRTNPNTNQWFNEVMDLQYLRPSEADTQFNDNMILWWKEFDLAVWSKLPGWIKKKIGNAANFDDLKNYIPAEEFNKFKAV